MDDIYKEVHFILWKEEPLKQMSKIGINFVVVSSIC